MRCYKCSAKLDIRKIGFRDCCPKCNADLHVCHNCKYFQIGKPVDCSIPNIDPVKEKEKNNFCEEFSLKEPKSPPLENKENVAKKLFKDDDGPPPKKDFNSLFKD